MCIEFSTNCGREARKRLEADGGYSTDGITKIVSWVENGWVRICDATMYGEVKLAFHSVEPFQKMFPKAKDCEDACYMALESCSKPKVKEG